MTTAPYIFPPDRAITHLPFAIRWDWQTNTYTAWYTDFPFILVQVKDKMQAREQLRKLLAVWINDICKTKP